MNRFLLSGFIIFLMAGLPNHAAAHGTDYRLLENGRIIAAEFLYSDSEPMRYTEVLVFSPGNDEVEYQNGRTDQMGRFAFCPEQPGMWQVKVNDGMGHAVHAKVEVESPETAGDGAVSAAEIRNAGIAQGSMLFKILFGLSLLLNIFLGLYAWKRPVTPS